MTRTEKFLLPFLVLGLIAFSGCGSKTKGPKTVPVSGTLKIGGAPAPNIQVNLVPEEEGLQIASGKTDDTGHFDLVTGPGAPGAMVGKYKVVLQEIPGEDDSYMNQTEDNAKESEDGGVVDPTQGGSGKIPEKYLKKETSDKEVTISGKTSNLEIDIE